MPKNMKKPSPRIPKGSFRRLMKDIFSFFPLSWIVVFVCLALVVCANASASIFLTQITKFTIEGVENGWESVKKGMWNLLFVMIAVRGSGVIASTIQNLLMARITQGSLLKIRIKMFNAMEKLPIRYFDSHNSGDIMSYYTNDTDSLRMLISQCITALVQSVIMLIILLAIMLSTSIWLSLIIFLGIVVMFNVTKKVTGNAGQGFIAQQKNIARVEGFVEEMMHGQKVVKVFCHEEEAKKDFDKLNDELRKAQEFAESNASKMGPITMNIGNIMYVLLAFLGGVLIALSLKGFNVYNLTIFGVKKIELNTFLPTLVAFLTLCRQFTNNVNQCTQQFNQIVMALAAGGRIYALIDEKEEVDEGYVTLVNAKFNENGEIEESKERTNIWAWKHPHQDGSITYTQVKGDIRMFNVDFGYVENKQILYNINLYANRGEKVAFVGATGAGKTTITNLINRFYDIQRGSITYDGIDVKLIKKDSLRHSLGIVLQDTHLFTGTIADNIRYGKEDATDEEVIAAAKLANADTFIRHLEHGYDTWISGDGTSLSQGQRQLLSIARAALANSPVLILDEATSSIDSRTEKIVTEGMDKLMHGRTVFVIAHRLSTIRNSDVIMVMDQGKIVERGNHERLMQEKGVYYQLYTGGLELD